MRMNSNAIRKLVHIQKKALERAPHAILEVLRKRRPRYEKDVSGLGMFEDEPSYLRFVDEYQMWFAQMPTPYQEPIFFMLLKRAFETLDRVVGLQQILFNDVLIEPKPLPIYGSIQAKIFNAFILAPGGEPLIVFTEGLFPLATGISNVIGAVVYNNARKRKNINRYNQIIKYFIDMLLSFLLFGTIEFARGISFIDREETVLSTQIASSYLLFVVAHEYSHLVLGHLKGANMHSAHVSGEKTSIISISWQKELEADALASILCIKNTSTTFEISILGIFLFLNILRIVEMNEQFEYITHPPADVRAERIYATLLNYSRDHHLFAMADRIVEQMLCQYLAFIDYTNAKDIKLIPSNFPIIQTMLYDEYEISFHET